MRFGIGQPVMRKEDPRFLTGRGHYVADIDFVRQGHAVFLYSPHAHARIRGIDKGAAERMPGVVAVLTGADWAADGLGALEPEVMAEDMGGPPGLPHQASALGAPIACAVSASASPWSIAATEAQARDAAELISVDYEVLPAVVRAEDAVRAGAPLVHEGAADNTSFTMRMGNAGAVDAAFARAHHVTRLSLHNNRITAVTMEPRGCIAEYDPGYRPLHALQQHAKRAWRAPHPGASDPACAGEPHPRRRPRCRRRLWHEGQRLSRGSGRRLGRPPRRPAGQMDPVAHRGAARRRPGPRPEGRPPSWRSTPTASFWRCAGPARTMPAPISRAPARS